MENILIIIIKYLLSSLFFVVIMHEIGHIIAALFCGYKFSGLYFLFFSIEKENKKWKIEKLDKKYRSIAVFSVKDSNTLTYEYVLITIAGSLSNIFCAIILINSSDIILKITGFSCLISGILNFCPLFFDYLSDGSKIFRILNKKTRKLEILDYNIAQQIYRDGILILDDVEKLINSNINYYMVKGYYYKSLINSISKEEKDEITLKQSSLKLERGLKCFKVS